MVAAAIANVMAEDGAVPANAGEHPDLASLAIPQTFTYDLRDVYLTREIEDLSSEETGITRSGDSAAIRTKTSVTDTTSVGDSSVSTDSSEQSNRKKSGTHFDAGGGVKLKWGVIPSVSGSAGLSHSRDWENESVHGQRRTNEKRADRTITITQSGEITDTASLENLSEVSNKSRIGKYILRFSVVLQNRDSSDTLIVDGDNMLARLRGSGLTGTISVPYRERGAFRIDAGDAITCSFACEIKDANQLRDLLRLRDEGELIQRLKLDVSGADFPIVSGKTGKNVLAEQKAAELRRPSTLIAVDFGEMEKFSPWCVSRRHTKESGQRGKPVTLREALQAVEAIAINQSDTLNGFVFSKEGHLAQIDDRPLMSKDEDYRMFAARFENKDGTPELHIPTSEVLNITIQNYAKISFFDFTFDEFAEMAVLLPTHFSTLRKDIEEWLAKANDKEAAKVLADLLEKKQKEDDVRDLPEDKESITKADVERFRLRAEAGIPEMQNKYAACLLHGWGEASNHVEAVEWFRKAAEQENSVAQNMLGVCYYDGKGVTQDHKEAVIWFRKAADQGDANAQNSLGVCYYRGLGVPQDHKEAVIWFRKAAEQDDSTAQWDLGVCYYAGKGVEQDFKEAVRWYRKAADQGNAMAQNSLGDRYYFGKGVVQDYAEAVRWYRKAAEQGHAAAQKSLGDCYYWGEGVVQDYAEAVRWYRKAAEQGNASAQGRLGICYYKGKGVGQDYAEAAKWYRKAAEQGNELGQFWLGDCYYSGNGVEQDYAEAVKWYRKAADQGHEKAKQRLKEIEKEVHGKR